VAKLIPPPVLGVSKSFNEFLWPLLFDWLIFY
jgi:hypothetical protein